MTYFNAYYNRRTGKITCDDEPIHFRAPTEQEKNAAWKTYGKKWTDFQDGKEYYRKFPRYTNKIILI
jgi:hypothetical protein